MGDTPKCNTYLYRETEIKAKAFDVLDDLALDDDLNLDTEEIEHIRFAFAQLIKALIEEV